MTAQATAPPQLVKSAASLIFTMPERKVLTGGGPSLHAPGQLSAASQADLDRTQVAQLADEAAEAVHLLDGGGEGRAGGARLVTDALDKVAAKAEGLLRAGRGPLALEALVAVAGEVVRPDEVPRLPAGAAGAVWEAIANSGVLGRLAFAVERAIPLCQQGSCQEFVNPVEKLVARGGADFGDALAALRARALMRRKATL